MRENTKSEVFCEKSVWKWYVYTLKLAQQPQNYRNWYFLEQNVHFRGISKGLWTIPHENKHRESIHRCSSTSYASNIICKHILTTEDTQPVSSLPYKVVATGSGGSEFAL